MDRSRAKLARKLRLLEELKWILMFAAAVYVVILLISAQKAPPLVARLLVKRFDLDWEPENVINDNDKGGFQNETENSTMKIKKVTAVVITRTNSREEIGVGGDHEEEKRRTSENDKEVEGIEKAFITVFRVLYLVFAAIQAFGIVGAWREKYRTTATFLAVHFLMMITSWTLLFTSKCLWTVLNAAWTLIIAVFGCLFLWNLYIKRLIVKGADGDVNFDELW